MRALCSATEASMIGADTEDSRIVDALAQQGIEIDRKIVKLPSAIKSTGSHAVNVRFSQHVKAELKVNVVGV